jgi:hypothetical protein
VAGGADDPHPARIGSVLGSTTGEGRQERVMDIDYLVVHGPDERRRDDLHVACEHDEVDLLLMYRP